METHSSDSSMLKQTTGVIQAALHHTQCLKLLQRQQGQKAEQQSTAALHSSTTKQTQDLDLYNYLLLKPYEP